MRHSPTDPLWSLLVAQNSAEPISRADLPEVARVLWSANDRPDHYADDSQKSIGYAELNKRFGYARGAGALNASGYLEIDDKWSPGLTRKTRITDSLNDLYHQFVELKTSQPFVERSDAPERRGAFMSRDNEGNECRARYEISEWVKVNVQALLNLYNDECYSEIVPLRQCEKEWRREVRIEAGKMAALAIDNGGYLRQLYTEHSGSRLFIHGPVSLQNASRLVRDAALSGCDDWDVKNCYPVIYLQQAQRYGVKCPALQHYITNRDETLDSIAAELNCNRKQVKAAILALQHYAGIDGVIEATGKKRMTPLTSEQAKQFLEIPYIKTLAKEFKRIGKAWIADVASRPGHCIVNAMGKGIPRRSHGRPTPNRKIISHLLQGIESCIMEVVREYYSESISLLQHDGFVSTGKIHKAFIERKVQQQTGFKITLTSEPITSKYAEVKRSCSDESKVQKIPAFIESNDLSELLPRLVKGSGCGVGGGRVVVVGGRLAWLGWDPPCSGRSFASFLKKNTDGGSTEDKRCASENTEVQQ